MNDTEDATESETELSPKQTAVLVQLVAGVDVEKAAVLAGAGERTVWRWLGENKPFRRELRLRQRQAMEAATRKLQSAAVKAVETLEAVMADATAPHAARVSAAKTILDTGYRAVELADVVQRLEELEASQQGGSS